MQQEHFSYKTIAKPAEGQYRERGSRFLSFAFPVVSEAEIKHYLAALQKTYFDARHHCFAWRLGYDGKSFRSFDDGEPHHSAGDPILGQIRSRGLTNVLVVVVRYFGGVKLGVGGLISAYKVAAEEALNQAGIQEKEVMDALKMIYDYSATPEIMRLVKEFDLTILSQVFESECELITEYKIRDRKLLFEKLDLLKATGKKLRYE